MQKCQHWKFGFVPGVSCVLFFLAATVKTKCINSKDTLHIYIFRVLWKSIWHKFEILFQIWKSRYVALQTCFVDHTLWKHIILKQTECSSSVISAGTSPNRFRLNFLLDILTKNYRHTERCRSAGPDYTESCVKLLTYNKTRDYAIVRK